jgi:CHAT domain-containing protein/Tfp pilus assembly protein PilF
MRERIALVLLAGLTITPAVLAVAPPPVPQYLRLLRGEQVREADQLQGEIDQLEAKRNYPQALALARRLLALHSRVQGADHWQAINAFWQVREFERVAKVSASRQAEYGGISKQMASTRDLFARRRYRDAELVCRRVLARRREVLGEDHPETASSYSNVAFFLLEQGKYVESQPLHEKALAIRRRTLGEEHPDLARSYTNLAACLKGQYQYAQARLLYEKALLIRRKVLGEEHLATAISCENLADCLETLGQFSRALPLYEKAAAIYRKARGETNPETATRIENLALCLDHLGRHTKAMPLYHKVLAINQKHRGDSHPDTAITRCNLACCLYFQGQYAQARQMFEKALPILSKALGQDHTSTAAAYNNLGLCLNAQGQHAEAQCLYEKALRIRRKVLGEEHHATATTWAHMAASRDEQGELDRALPVHEKALAIRRKVLGEQHPATATSYNNLARCRLLRGQKARAHQLFEKALAIRVEVFGQDHPDTATSYNNLAECLRSQGKPELARPLYDKVLAIQRKLLGEEHSEVATACNNLALCLVDQKEYARALLLHDKALTIVRKAVGEEHPHTAVCYHNLALCLEAMDSYELAEWMAVRACRSLRAARLRVGFSGLERTSFTERYPSQFYLAVLRFRAGKSVAAWEALEQHLARGLNDEVAARRRLLSLKDQQELKRLRDRGQLLDRQLLALSGKRDPGSRREAERLREQLRGRSREMGELQARLAREHGPVAGATFSLERIQQSLPDDGALVVWLDFRRGSAACLLRRRGPPVLIHLPRGNKADIDDLALELSRPPVDEQAWLAPAQRLYRQRLAPLEKHLGATDDLPAVRHLVVLPSPALAEVPVEVLVAAGKRDLTVSYAPSGTLFAFLRQRKSKPGPARVLALGDPLFAQPDDHADLSRAVRQHFAPLPGTRGEVEAIARLFPTADTLLGARASEQVLDGMVSQGKLKGYRFLHLATHGQASSRRPLESSLALSDRDLPDPLSRVLAGKPAYTGRLTAGHILQSWELDAELVVLSACRTGLGRYEGGEGYVGFAQPLFAVGARSLVMSLWSVSDTATALLMVRFYQNLLGKRPDLKQPLSRSEALAEAKRWLRSLSTEQADKALLTLSPKLKLTESERGRKGRPFEHPFFWAAFILAGDPGPIG